MFKFVPAYFIVLRWHAESFGTIFCFAGSFSLVGGVPGRRGGPTAVVAAEDSSWPVVTEVFFPPCSNTSLFEQ